MGPSLGDGSPLTVKASPSVLGLAGVLIVASIVPVAIGTGVRMKSRDGGWARKIFWMTSTFELGRHEENTLSAHALIGVPSATQPVIKIQFSFWD